MTGGSRNGGILKRLAAAGSEGEVGEVLGDRFFSDATWKPLGGEYNNYAIVGNQQSEAVNALCEKPINSIDHILLKRCRLAGDDPESRRTPRTMKGAVEKYLGIPGGDYGRLDDAKMLDLAKNIQIIADGPKRRPCITVADRGEGQRPEDFEDTLLSLQKGNKQKIRFVQGKYNMGGTGVLPFCGKKGYQLILSRRSTELDGDGGKWGFTLVREKPDVPEPNKTSWYEYFVGPDGGICELPGGPLPVLPGGGALRDGCLVKMFSYDLPNPSMITGRLWAAMNAVLYSPAIPMWMLDARDAFILPMDADKRRKIMYGNANRVRRDAKEYVKTAFTIKSKLREFGTGSIGVTVFKHASSTGKKNSTQDFRAKSEAVLLTQNGQTHAPISQTKFKSKTEFSALADYVMLHVDLTGIPKSKAKMFLSSRDRARKSADYKLLEARIFEDVKDDEHMKALNDEYRELDDRSSVKDSSMDEAIAEVIRKNPSMAEVLAKGDVPAEGGKGPGEQEGDGDGNAEGGGGGDGPGGKPEPEPFSPSYIPTYLEVAAGEARYVAGGPHRKQIPPDGRPAYLRLKTDAPNDYTTRDADAGRLTVEFPDALEGAYHPPFSGSITVRVQGEGASYSSAGILRATLTRPGDDPLECVVQVYFGAKRKKAGPKGRGGVDDPPKFAWVAKRDWGTWGWDGASVSSADGETIRVNRHCRFLEDFAEGRPAGERGRLASRFGMHVYLASLMLHRTLDRDAENYEEIYKNSVAAVARSCLSASHDFDDAAVERIVGTTDA